MEKDTFNTMERTHKSLPIHKGKDQTVFKMEPGNSNLIPCLLNTPLFMCSGKCLDREALSQCDGCVQEQRKIVC